MCQKTSTNSLSLCAHSHRAFSKPPITRLTSRAMRVRLLFALHLAISAPTTPALFPLLCQPPFFDTSACSRSRATEPGQMVSAVSEAPEVQAAFPPGSAGAYPLVFEPPPSNPCDVKSAPAIPVLSLYLSQAWSFRLRQRHHQPFFDA